MISRTILEIVYSEFDEMDYHLGVSDKLLIIKILGDTNLYRRNIDNALYDVLAIYQMFN
ncbi:MAG: hypothetical protein Q8Q35_04385 [Nanoarchaeota archaeon]|nr:hypothetical protein [Nanoarchaeota archaeon]